MSESNSSLDLCEHTRDTTPDVKSSLDDFITKRLKRPDTSNRQSQTIDEVLEQEDKLMDELESKRRISVELRSDVEVLETHKQENEERFEKVHETLLNLLLSSHAKLQAIPPNNPNSAVLEVRISQLAERLLQIREAYVPNAHHEPNNDLQRLLTPSRGTTSRESRPRTATSIKR